MERLKTYYNLFINKGTKYHTSPDDKRRVRLLNFASLASFLVLLPVIIPLNLVEKDYGEIVWVVIMLVITTAGLGLNAKGKSQAAILVFALSVMCFSVAITLRNQIQSAAPFINILIGMISMHMIKKNWLKGLIYALSSATFLGAFFYQTQYLPFAWLEFIPLLPVFFLFYLGLQNYETEHHRNRRDIENQNQQLREQKELIKQQSEEVIALQEVQHAQELELKQKDIDTVLTSNQIQVQLKENIIKKLEGIGSKDDMGKEINRLIFELKSQDETQEKISLLNENLDVVNNAFYQRLLAQHPGLSKSEKELCAYLRLNLSTKEIANLKNTSDNTINVAKTRLRKKLSLQSNAMLNNYLMGV